MAISLVFSLIIYSAICQELGRGLRRAEIHFLTGDQNLASPLLPRRWQIVSPQLVQELAAAKKRVAFNLLLINGGILVLSATAGYFLAGQTLRPIEKALEEQKRFVADASHELRTPLTALKTAIEVSLRDQKLDLPQAKTTLQESMEDINHLETLTTNLLKLARYQDGNGYLEFNAVDMEDLTKEALVKISPLAKAKGITLVSHTSSLLAEGHQPSLAEMLLIFLDNAVKYTPAGGRVTLNARKEGKQLVLQIEDTGLGIAPEALPHIFDRFYRVDQARSKETTPGFGLGLSLAKRIIDIHHGSVQVKSLLNHGTTFQIKLPLRHS